MGQDELQQWLGDNGGSALTYSPKAATRKIANPDFGKPGHASAPAEIEVAIQEWYNPNTKARLRVYQLPGQDGYEIDRQVDSSTAPGAQTAATATNTSSTYKWVDVGNGQRRLHVITQDKNGAQIADDEATPDQQRAYEVSEQRSRNPGGQSDDEIKKDADAAAAQSRADEALRLQQESGKRAAEAAALSAKNQGDQLVLDTAREQRLSDADAAKLRNGDVVQLAGGRLIQIQHDADGKAVVTDASPKPVGGANPQFGDGDAVYGRIGQSLIKKLTELHADPNVPDAIKKDRAEQLINTAQMLEGEFRNTVSTQQDIYKSDASVYGNQLQDVQSKRALGQNSATYALDFLKAVGPYATDGAMLGKAFMGMALLPMRMAAQAGGMDQVQAPQKGPALQQAATTSLPNQPSPAPVPVTINNVTAPAGPQMAPSMFGDPNASFGGGVDPSMRVDNGQLKAPGVSANPDDPQARAFPWLSGVA